MCLSEVAFTPTYRKSGRGFHFPRVRSRKRTRPLEKLASVFGNNLDLVPLAEGQCGKVGVIPVVVPLVCHVKPFCLAMHHIGLELVESRLWMVLSSHMDGTLCS